MSNSRSYYRRRSLFGPFLIVAVGIIALLGTLGYISRAGFFNWFGRYWPLLLIVWGVAKFIEYLMARERNEPYSGIGGGAIVFLVFLILFGLMVTGLSRVNWEFVDMHGGDDWDTLGIFGTRYEFNENFAQPMVTGTQVRVLSARGEITITPSPDNQAHLFVHKYVRSHSQNEANQINDATHPKFEQQGNVWLLEMNAGSYQRGRFDMELQLPAKYGLSVMDRRGDVHVSQLQADVDVETNRGDITAEQIKGNAALRVHRGDVTAKNIEGNVSVDGDVSDSNVSDVTGTLTFTGSYTGDIQLSHIGNQVRFNSIRTDLQFAKLDGDLRMDRGDFRANALAGPFRLRTETKDVHMEDVSGDVQIEDRRGDIRVQTKAPVGNLDISTTGGEINVSLPEKPGFQMDAASDGGEIQSDFSLTINNDRHNATATGSVGNGKAQVKLRTNRGTIQIHKG